jgi:hypothetical protein
MTAEIIELFAESGQPPQDDLHQLTGLLVSQLQELATGIQRAGGAWRARAGAEPAPDLEHTREVAAAAVAALDHVRQMLTGYSFIEA